MTTRLLASALVALNALAVALSLAPAAEAFCGFYVSGADAKLFNNATLVVMMREGKRTVLSMQNNYQGPPESFAMVVPVPVVLQKENVKTLPREIFARVDSLAAPRLVEYWEQDPCAEPEERVKGRARAAAPGDPEAKSDEGGGRHGVKVEAQFTVGEYEIVILSAADSAGLETWLEEEKYHIPANAEPLLRPYVEQGSKFFVAKVAVDKVTMKDGQAMLSPLRFHYDDDEFRLPVRLGLVNSQGTQDLLVHILARRQRYAVANYPNVTIPTNLDVKEDAKERFGELYAALFDATLDKNKGAVITEYAWDASSCDPCPVPALAPNELATLGLDVLVDTQGKPCAEDDPLCSDSDPARVNPHGFVLTRLHVRYGKDSLGEDLVFKQAEAITGGREVRVKGDELEHGSQPGRMNNFQARYAIRHPWTGAKDCPNPRFGVWGGPPGGKEPSKTRAALDLAFVKRGGVKLAEMLTSGAPELDIEPLKPAPRPKREAPSEPSAAAPQTSAEGCGCRLGDHPPPRHAWLLGGAALAWLLRRARRRETR
jgi:MYXO-CTERM domain-containing protein